MESVYCDARTGSLNKSGYFSFLKGYISLTKTEVPCLDAESTFPRDRDGVRTQSARYTNGAWLPVC
jgi:hypothetical protein